MDSMNENYYLLADMEKYDKSFDRKVFEHLSIERLKSLFKDYYSKKLPVDVTTWVRVNEPDEKLIYKDEQVKQILFVRDTIMRELFYTGEWDEKRFDEFQPKVISVHTSKSVLLPVMEIYLKEYGVILTLRANFHNWNISIESEQDIEFDHKGLINDEAHSYCFCEGFPSYKIFGKYKDNKKKFTFCLNSDYELHTFMFIIRDWFKHKCI